MLSRVFKSSLFKSSVIYTITDAMNKAIPFFILPILSHYLLPADYGIVANFGVLSGIVGLLISCSMEGAISVNYHKLEKSQISTYIFNAIILSTILFAILILIVLLANEWIIKSLQIPFKYQILCIVVCYANLITSINLTLWRLEEKSFFFGVYNLSNTIINLGLSLFLIITLNQNWEGRVNGIIFAGLLYGLISLYILIKRNYINFTYNKSLFRDAVVFGIPLIPHALSFWLRSGVDRIWITKFWGTDAVGLYATGFQFGLLISFLISSFNNAYSPYLYKSLSETNPEILNRNKQKMVKITYLMVAGLTLMSLLIILFSNFFISSFFAEQYIKSTTYVKFAIIAQLFQSFYVLFVNYIFFTKKTKQLATITFLCSLLQVGLSYILVKNMGPIGAAYSTITISIINFVIILIYSNNVYQMPWLKLKYKS